MRLSSKLLYLNLKSGGFLSLQAQQRGSQEFDFEMFHQYFLRSSHDDYEKQWQIIVHYYFLKQFVDLDLV